ncbi:MAG: DNA repair exonuclease [Candidatus Dadabacteria bacterium]|nr:MAG: DNA repair exonuclease [Candidatus Dadabacteria bacterium]
MGRRPRLPEGAQDVDATPAEAWRRTVNYALDSKPAADLLAGDVVDADRDFFEGYRELRAGVERLAAAGIRVIAVAGNHDIHVLPRLADEIPALELLGRGGVWEATTIEANGEAATIVGWSFPREQVRQSPLEGATLPEGTGVRIGLLHADLDNPGSSHAPVRRAELAASGLDAWLVGHIHVPDALSVDQRMGYLGTLAPLDPTETGLRGPWRIEIVGTQIATFDHIPLAPVRWQREKIDLSGINTLDGVESKLLQHMRSVQENAKAAACIPNLVAVRADLVGASKLPETRLQNIEPNELYLPGHPAVAIDRLRNLTSPALDLDVLSHRRDVIGALAGLAKRLESGAPSAEDLQWLGRIDTLADSLRRRGGFAAVAPAELPLPRSEEARLDLLQRAAKRLLRTLVTQSETSS